MTKNRFERYDEYRDSGVEWLGEIPVGWEVKKIKQISKIINGATPHSGTEKYWDGKIIWLTPTDMNNSKVMANSERKLTFLGYQNCGASFVQKGSIVLTTRAPIGKVVIAGTSLCTNQGCKSLVLSKVINETYIYYFISISSPVLNSLGTGTTFMELGNTPLKKFQLPIPKIEVQTAIANFLDRKTAKINRAIAQKEKLIGLLKERKQIVIQNAVTKGLDPTVKMKDSGVEWIGEIPVGWSVLPGLNFVFEGKEKNIGMKRNTVLSLSYGRIRVKKEEELTGLVPESFETYQLVNEGDIIFRPTDLQNDKVSLRSSISEFEGIITSAYLNLRFKGTANPKFYHYFFRSIDNNKVIYGLGSGLRQNINYKDFRRFDFPFPPLLEQTTIADFLDQKTVKIDKAITLQEKQITKLKEYKATLIDSAVTGKIKIC